MEIYNDFSKWLDKHLIEDLPSDIAAVNFNLYEGSEQTYDVELVGCNTFDENDGDWACDAIFSTSEDLFFIPLTEGIAHWEQALSFITILVEKYLNDGNYSDKLKKYLAVGIGFVDGDINILYRSK